MAKNVPCNIKEDWTGSPPSTGLLTSLWRAMKNCLISQLVFPRATLSSRRPAYRTETRPQNKVLQSGREVCICSQSASEGCEVKAVACADMQSKRKSDFLKLSFQSWFCGGQWMWLVVVAMESALAMHWQVLVKEASVRWWLLTWSDGWCRGRTKD